MEPTAKLPVLVVVMRKLSKLTVPPAAVWVKTNPAPVILPVKLVEIAEPMVAPVPVPLPLTDNESHCEAAGLNTFEQVAKGPTVAGTGKVFAETNQLPPFICTANLAVTLAGVR